MIKCNQCPKELKNENGLRLHLRACKGEVELKGIDQTYQGDEFPATIAISVDEYKEYEQLKKDKEKKVQSEIKATQVATEGKFDHWAIAGTLIAELNSTVYQEIFERYFDPADGFEAKINSPEHNEDEDKITFTIRVPKKYSNAQEAHWSMYRDDLRTVAIHPSQMKLGVENQCKRVIRNLNYNKDIKTKL